MAGCSRNKAASQCRRFLGPFRSARQGQRRARVIFQPRRSGFQPSGFGDERLGGREPAKRRHPMRLRFDNNQFREVGRLIHVSLKCSSRRSKRVRGTPSKRAACALLPLA